MLDTQTIQMQDQSWQPLQLRLHEALMDAAKREPDRVGWVFGDERVTFAAMAAGTKRLALVFARAGIGPGDTVVVWLPNEMTWAYALYACSMIGARLAAINTRAKTDEAAHVIRDSRAKLLLFRPWFLNIDYLDILRGVSPALAALPAMERTNAHSSQTHVLSLGGAESTQPQRLENLYKLIAGAELPPIPDRLAPDKEAVLIQYTSGSTNMPKGTLLHHVHVLNFGYPVTVRLGVGAGESLLNTQPFYHIGGSCGCLSVPLLLDCIMVIPEYYEPELVLRLLARERCVARTGMATMYLREMQVPNFRGYDLTSLRNGWCIAPPAVLDRIRAEYPIEGLVQLYGSSEGGGTCGTFTDPWAVRRLSSGSPFPGTEFSIVDPETELDMPTGQTGEIRFRGWALCLGYVSSASDAETFDQHGRFRSGDLGHLDEHGELYFDGRIKDIIKPGGENVSALEVEIFLQEHPAIHQVAVVGVPDDDLGEAVMAIIELAEGHSLTHEILVAHCRGKIANFRIPRHLRIVTEWPMTGSGKILKRILQAQYAKELEAARLTP